MVFLAVTWVLLGVFCGFAFARFWCVSGLFVPGFWAIWVCALAWVFSIWADLGGWLVIWLVLWVYFGLVSGGISGMFLIGFCGLN